MPKFINEILLITSIIASVGLIYIIYSRDTKHTSAKIYIMTLILIIGYIISHGIHFLYLKDNNVTILDQSCHSFLLLILLSLTLFSLYFPAETKINNWIKAIILLPSLVMLFGLWDNWFLLSSHSHGGKFEAHYTKYYPVFIAWYGFLLLFNIIVLIIKYRNIQDEKGKSQILLFIASLIFTDILAATFGMVLPWLLGFYYLVEISPASFIAGVFLFTTIGISKYNLFPVVTEKLHSFSIIKKVIFSAIVVVPIIIILFQIPLGRVVLSVNNTDLWSKYFILSLISGILVSVTMTFVIVKIIADPINNLRMKAEQIRRGKFGETVNYYSNDEIGALAETFNAMSIQLKKDADELKKQQTHISMLLKAIEHSNAGICILNGDYRIIEANQKFYKFHSGKTKFHQGELLLNLYKRIMAPKDITEIKEALELSKNMEKEIRITSGDGSHKTMLISITNFFLFDATPAFIIVEVDITDIKHLERQLFESEKLAELGKMAAVLAHEIKTPLTSIKMNVDILSSMESLSPDDKNSFRIINREVNRLDKLAKEVLQYSRQTDLHLSNFNIRILIDEIILNIRTQHPEIEFLNLLDDRNITADKEKLHQVFNNLILNAIEAIDDNGKIVVYGREDEKVFKVFIEDNGKGIADNEKEIIFNPFVTFKTSGTGLGLAIAKKIMEQHNFNLNLEHSEKGKTVFCLTFQ